MKGAPAVLKKLSPVLIPLAAIGLAAVINLCFVVNAHIPSGSMEPTIGEGAFVLGIRGDFTDGSLQNGDIIFFHKNTESEHLLIKRVIALPRQTFEMRQGRVYIDGTPLDEPYIPEPSSDDYPLTQVPEGACIVLGDNRTASTDSRYFEDPFVYLEDVVARAELTWFPKFKKLD